MAPRRWQPQPPWLWTEKGKRTTKTRKKGCIGDCIETWKEPTHCNRSVYAHFAVTVRFTYAHFAQYYNEVHHTPTLHSYSEVCHTPTSHGVTVRFTICPFQLQWGSLYAHPQLQWGSPYYHFTPSYNEVHHPPTSQLQWGSPYAHLPQSYNQVHDH